MERGRGRQKVPLDWTSRSTSASDVSGGQDLTSAAGSGGQSSSRSGTGQSPARSGRDSSSAAEAFSDGVKALLAKASGKAMLSRRPGMLEDGDECVDIRVKHTFLDIPDFKPFELDGFLQHRQVVSAPATAVHSRESSPVRTWRFSSASAAAAEDERLPGTPPLPAARRSDQSLALALVPGLISNPEMMTFGSAGHAHGKCKPCAFIHKQGCESGVACRFCHLCQPGEKKRRKKVRKTKEAIKKARAEKLQPTRPP
mmetsp:Transcript_55278/g.103869  ORF Transcript_55278/g.103869 Transcript_55278/m.103869 type:complete len:256 (+) Transcript_55278:35-802(+)